MKVLYIILPLFSFFLEEPGRISFDFQVVYELDYQPDSTQISSRRKIMTELLVNDTLSAFHTIDKFVKDSAFFHSTLKTGLMASYIGVIDQLKFEILKRADRIEVYEPLNGLSLDINNQLYTYSEEAELFDWQIHDETKSISDMLCQKATIDWGGETLGCLVCSGDPYYQRTVQVSGATWVDYFHAGR